VREGIVADVVEQRRHSDCEAVFRRRGPDLAELLECGERTAGQVVGTQSMLEPRMGRAGVHQESVPDLADIAETLDGGGVQREKGRPVEANVVPEWIADHFRGGKGGKVGKVGKVADGRGCLGGPKSTDV
jgi:hypothetical protein